MTRMIGLLAAAALLAGCGGKPAEGGAAKGAPGAAGGDYKAKMGDAMKPCATAGKAAAKMVGDFKSKKATQGEAIEAADESVAVCETAYAAWAAMKMPPAVADPCMQEAQSRLQLAYAARAAMNHNVSGPYKKAMSVAEERSKRFEGECKAAVKA